jgi:hypothetical protein
MHTVAAEVPARQPRGRPRPTKRPVVTINNDSIFVVHGRDIQLNTDAKVELGRELP